MKITLISVDAELFCIGTRLLSAILRQADHQVTCVFLPPDAANRQKRKFQAAYTHALLDRSRTPSNTVGVCRV